MVTIKNYIGGALVGAITGATFDDMDPATGTVCASVPDSDRQDVDAAVTAAAAAFPSWSSLPADNRSRLLFRVGELIEENLDDLAGTESLDTGKPLHLARTVDIPRAVSNFRFFASALMHFASEAHPMEGTAINYTLRQPLGVVGCISPWNLPLYLFTWKIAPALATGNCVVAKPSEITPLTAFKLGELCIKAGLPPGVLNIVHGFGAKVGASMVAHSDIQAITFTGGTTTGGEIAKSAAPLFKKLSLEMGGKNPTIIFSDCDYESMLETTVRSSFSNQGEICLCGSRILVEKSLYERFRKDFVDRVQSLKVGDPLKGDTDLGAIVSKQHFEKIRSYIALARTEGGKILCGGSSVNVQGRCSGGLFLQPTVIEGLSQTCRTNQEEIFGPVVTLSPFETEDEAVAGANATRYGLASMLWTENLTRAHRVAGRIHTGIVWVNCWMVRDLRTPFGGMKQSGLGREGGWEAMRFFTEPRNICVKL